MTTRHALIISSHALFAEAITRLLQEEGVEVVAKAESVKDALSWLKEQKVEAIIVDYDDSQLRNGKVVSHLVERDEECRTIFLTLSGNQMIVHHRERVENVTPKDLVRAIRFSSE